MHFSGVQTYSHTTHTTHTTHTRTHVQAHTCTHTHCTHAPSLCAHAPMHTHTHAHTRAHTHVHTHTHAYTRTHTYMHTRAHTHAHTCHTHPHTHIPTHPHITPTHPHPYTHTPTHPHITHTQRTNKMLGAAISGHTPQPRLGPPCATSGELWPSTRQTPEVEPSLSTHRNTDYAFQLRHGHTAVPSSYGVATLQSHPAMVWPPCSPTCALVEYSTASGLVHPQVPRLLLYLGSG